MVSSNNELLGQDLSMEADAVVRHNKKVFTETELTIKVAM